MSLSCLIITTVCEKFFSSLDSIATLVMYYVRLYSCIYIPLYLRWSMRFLRSEFRGQLPGRYREDLPLQQATSMNRPNEFNDMNLEEESRYVSRIQMN